MAQGRTTPTATITGLNPEDLNNSHAIILISVDPEPTEKSHTGKNLALTVKALGKLFYKCLKHQQRSADPSTFVMPRATIIIAGTLQRYNFWSYLKKMTDNEIQLCFIASTRSSSTLVDYLANHFFTAASQQEKKYSQENSEILSKSSVFMWEEYKKSIKNYANDYEQVTLLFLQSKEFQEAVTSTAEKFLKSKINLIEKQEKRIKQLVPDLQNISFLELAKHASIKYVLEECAAFLISIKTNIFYPGHKPEAFKALWKFFNCTQLVTWTHVEHKEKKSNVICVSSDDSDEDKIDELLSERKESNSPPKSTDSVVRLKLPQCPTAAHSAAAGNSSARQILIPTTINITLLQPEQSSQPKLPPSKTGSLPRLIPKQGAPRRLFSASYSRSLSRSSSDYSNTPSPSPPTESFSPDSSSPPFDDRFTHYSQLKTGRTTVRA